MSEEAVILLYAVAGLLEFAGVAVGMRAIRAATTWGDLEGDGIHTRAERRQVVPSGTLLLLGIVIGSAANISSAART